MNAFGNDERFHVTIVCSRLSDTLLQRYSNLSLIKRPNISDFLRSYQDADIVIVPMVENIFSGITVALEAVALGRPVLATRTGGVPTYFSDDEVLYVPAGDAHAMLDSVLGDSNKDCEDRVTRASTRFQRNDYSTHAMISRYVKITSRFIPAQVSPLDSLRSVSTHPAGDSGRLEQ